MIRKWRTMPINLRAATEGADALFWLSPPNFTAPSVKAYYAALRDAAAGAIKVNKIAHTVLIGSGAAAIAMQEW